MRPTSRRTKVIGFIGLGWFVYFAGSAVASLIWPEQLRAYSKEPWTDREINLCAACYITVGCAGLIVASKRLVLPLFQPGPQIGHNVAACIVSVGVLPEYDLYRHFHLRSMQRTIFWATFKRAISVVFLYLVIAQGPRFMGLPWPPPLPIHALFICGLVGLVALTFGIRWALASPWLRYKWNHYPYCREGRKFDFFEDGILEYGPGFICIFPWVRVRRVERVGEDVVAIELRRDWLIIPRSDEAPQAAIDRVVALLAMKVGKLHERDAMPRAQPVQLSQVSM